MLAIEPFLTQQELGEAGSRRFNRLVERLLGHLGFDDVRIIDGTGDGGGDILGVFEKELFVLQNKWTGRRSIGSDGIDEVERAKSKYSTDRAVLVTNATPDGSALRRQRQLRSVGIRIDIWPGAILPRLIGQAAEFMPRQIRLRPYQREAAARLQQDLREKRRALLILATGLGKTVVAGQVISDFLTDRPLADVLVVAHTKEIVEQLERALWRHLPKSVVTQLLTGDWRPSRLRGVTCATVESALGAVAEGYQPDLIMVDETHHVSESGEFQRLLDNLASAQQFGVTATPWRGDEYDITRRFGPVSFRMGIAEGMSQGFLAQADYRLFVDDLNWDLVRNVSRYGYSIRELNDRLFIPQRDEAMIDVLMEAWSQVVNPRAVIFCRTIEHAERMANQLASASPNWRRTTCIHSGQPSRQRHAIMSQFRLGRVPIITAVDVFNEGVDVPDVNIVCFMRVTHSRRIFVQQLGRGLRLAEDKQRVTVLDFVTDIRRIAAALDLKRSLTRMEPEVLDLQRTSIEFSDAAVASLMDAWIKDAAELESAADEVRLQFPDHLE